MEMQQTSSLQLLLAGDDFDGEVLEQEPMARHTTYRIGGPARFYVQIGSIVALEDLLETCLREGMPWVIVGRGSNLLVADEGFAGVIITLGRDFRSVRFDAEGNCFSAGAGAPLSTVVQQAALNAMAGLEFAVGTPGTIGGALRMNAGSRVEWIGSRVVHVTTFTPGRGVVCRPASEIEWGYRSSSFADDETILECEISVEQSDQSLVQDKMDENLARRKKTQPMNEACCGSVFRNPPAAAAAKLIEEAGLKGRQIGGAQVSPLHANFIINTGEATAHDVRSLMSLITEKVYEAHGIELTPEVRFLGFD